MENFAAGGSGVPGEGELDEEGSGDALLDTIMLRLRLGDGLDLEQLSLDFGSEAAAKTLAALEPHIKSGLALLTGGGGGRLPVVKLSDPGGFLVSNDIISDVFAAVMPE